MKRRLFNIAHSIKNQFESFADALVHAWKVIRLQFALCTEAIVNFTYKKVDGSIRKAKGSNANLPYTGASRKPVNYRLLTYWDLEAGAFRSCKIENLML